LNKDIA